MAFAVRAEAPPIRQEADDTLRVGRSRVLLELVIRAFHDGATPETIVQRYSTLSLSDVYPVIAYYLRHRDDVDAYVAGQERVAVQTRHRVEGANFS